MIRGTGPQNRESLTTLEIEIRSPIGVRQKADGIRVELKRANPMYEDVYQRHLRLTLVQHGSFLFLQFAHKGGFHFVISFVLPID